MLRKVNHLPSPSVIVTDETALYSFLSRHSFLDAAYLWLIARVTKEGLTNMPYETSGVSAPKKWRLIIG